MKKGTKLIPAFLLGCVILLYASPFLMLFIERGYRGEHRDLYTVAVHNIFAIYGYESNGEVSYDPDIQIIETDDYGRVLFFYSERYDGYTGDGVDYGMAVVIMQSSRDGYVWYYRDRCYMPCFDQADDWETVSASLMPEDLEALKRANDWNQELKEEDCAKVPITRKKPKGNLKPGGRFFDQLLYPYMKQNGYRGRDRSIYRFSRWSETDVYGRELYYVYGMTANPGFGGKTRYDTYEFAVILNADGTCPENGIAEIRTPADSAAVIRRLKQDTNWNVSGE